MYVIPEQFSTTGGLGLFLSIIVTTYLVHMVQNQENNSVLVCPYFDQLNKTFQFCFAKILIVIKEKSIPIPLSTIKFLREKMCIIVFN